MNYKLQTESLQHNGVMSLHLYSTLDGRCCKDVSTQMDNRYWLVYNDSKI